ncbi:MAG: HAMP domain-containing histidine kinase [Ignavibacteriales bacterium]|nr:MAG: HAMP domain-containing histidine kinase [Ignavibacteriales bacterium]
MNTFLPFWSEQLKDHLHCSNSIALGWFSLDGELKYANCFMEGLVGNKGTASFLNPDFTTLVSSPSLEGVIFQGYITFLSDSRLNTSLLAKVYKKDNEILVAGGVDVEQMINQNAVMFSLNQEISDLQRKVIDEKIALEIALKKLEEANKELITLNNTKDKFFSIIAHDLRSPFQGFMGLTEMLADEESSFTEKDFRRYSASLNKTARSLYSLLEDLLQWTQIQRNTIVQNSARISVEELINAVLHQFVSVALFKEITIRHEVEKGLSAVADMNMIQTVLRNLISNAIKFTNRKGSIFISAKRADNKALITVTDSGVGISPENQEKIFRIDAKFRTEGTEGEASTGLGLLLCKEFIEKNGGKLVLVSEEGKGSSFSFDIPLAQD